MLVGETVEFYLRKWGVCRSAQGGPAREARVFSLRHAGEHGSPRQPALRGSLTALSLTSPLTRVIAPVGGHPVCRGRQEAHRNILSRGVYFGNRKILSCIDGKKWCVHTAVRAWRGLAKFHVIAHYFMSAVMYVAFMARFMCTSQWWWWTGRLSVECLVRPVIYLFLCVYYFLFTL